MARIGKDNSTTMTNLASRGKHRRSWGNGTNMRRTKFKIGMTFTNDVNATGPTWGALNADDIPPLRHAPYFRYFMQM